MTLKTQKRLLDLEHISKYGPMRRMARRTLIGDISVLPGEGTDKLPVAVKTQPFLVQRNEAAGSLAAMGFMTIGAEHPALRNRMSCGEGKFRPDSIMASQAFPVDLHTF